MNEPDANPSPEATPDPHAGEPAPGQEGMRPEADPSVSWPGQTEPGGPMKGLMTTAGAETAAHFGNNPHAAAIAAAAGVEEEGLESGQLFGLMLATAAAVVVLIISVYFLFYSPLLQETLRTAADVPVDRYVELRDARTHGAFLLGAYGANDDGTYRIPIDEAMALVAGDYAGGAGADSLAAADAAAAPAANNGLTWLTLTPPPAVRALEGAASPAPALAAEPAEVAAADSL